MPKKKELDKVKRLPPAVHKIIVIIKLNYEASLRGSGVIMLL